MTTIVPRIRKKAIPEVSSEAWYRESSHRGDTHQGRLEDGVVRARCGVEFAPQVGLFGGEAAAAMLLMQAGQACRACCAQAGVSVAEVEEPPPNHARRDHGPIGRWVRRVPGATALPPAPAALLAPPPAPAAVLPPVPAAPPAAGKEATLTGKWWFQRSAEPGDTHWVITISRGTKTAACGASFQGKRARYPTLAQICSTCDAQRPR